MLKAIFLLIFSTLVIAEEHATYSIQRWQDKIVVTIDHDKGWHTYWKNPGDAGIASSFKFSQNNTPVAPSAYEWPAPMLYVEAGDIWTIGYEDRQHFFFENIPGAFEAYIGVLICKDVCIPGEARLSMGPDQQFASSRPANAFSSSDLRKAFESLPKASAPPEGFEYYLTRVKDQNLLTLHYTLKGATDTELPRRLPLLTAFPHQPFGFKREKLYFKDGILFGKTEIEWDGEYQEPPVALPEDGNFINPYELRFLLNAPNSNKVEVISLEADNFSVASPALDEFYRDLEAASSQSLALDEERSMLEYLLFAFLGGLILNLMPCVLPVISIKLFGLIRHRNYPRKKLLVHNSAYTLGVISTFMVLAGVIAALKAAGEEIGWGFQLQSPGFILVMILILFIMSLNLFGLFEFVTPGGGKLGSTETQEGFSGDFLSGILTTILSTPCSAPFLGTALTFAFTTSYAMIFVMFFFIGLGLAFPFLMTAIFPASLAIFPRPGAWMEKLKYFLGLSLIITVIWLYDVFVGLVDFDKVGWRLNLLLALWFFAFFFAQKIMRHRIVQFLIFALPLSLTVMALQNLEPRTSLSLVKPSKAEGQWSSWSEEKLQELKGKTVFMDFTAEWCLTCKVNKKLVLDTDGFVNMAQKNELVLLRGDWTRRDDNITRFLRANGAVGVPAYFIQKPDGSIIPLGETISIGKIEENLR